MARKLSPLLCAGLLALCAATSRADDTWVTAGNDGRPEIQLYLFWALFCPLCHEAVPHIEAMARERPWVRLHELELSRSPENVRLYQELAGRVGQEAMYVPAMLFCGQMHVGWESDATTGALLRRRLDECKARLSGRESQRPPVQTAPPPIQLPLIGAVDPADLSLPALTLILAGLDAFNPCAFFVLLFLLSMITHQKSRKRMLLIGGVFVLISGLMYFAFMAAWLSIFQLFGHFAWVTATAGALAMFVGMVNIKDFFLFQRGLSLSIPESKKPDIFRRARAILKAESLWAMLAATIFLAVAANFYELLCTAGLPMVYTRLLTLANLSAAGRYAYLAAYNVIYVLPLSAIVVAFAWTLGARRLTEREGRLLKLVSGVMMLGLGGLLFIAPERLSRAGTALALTALALAATWVAARLTRESH